MSLSDFVLLEKIGEGAYSSVYRIKKKADGKIYALKKVKMLNLKEKEKENALNEVRILASIEHTNIVSYKDAFFDEPSTCLCIIMDYAEKGDLQMVIDSHLKRRQFLPEEEIWKIILHCLRGLYTLHNLKILHRDLKCANIFIDKNGTYKIGDLNVSKVAKKGLVYTQTGTPYYASPEVWRDEPYDTKSDIWSFGAIIYEACALRPPFRARSMEELNKRVQKGVFERIPKQYSDDLFRFIQLCLQINSSIRPNCKQLLLNQYLKRNTAQFQEPVQEGIKDAYLPEENQNLLSTIKVPRNMKYLSSALPKSKYQ